MLQIVLVGLCYLLSSGITSGWIKKKFARSQTDSKKEVAGISMRDRVIKIAAGILSLLIIDLLSGGNPWWPALALLAALTGELFPLAKSDSHPEAGLIYFGGVFYLYPSLALAGLGLALQILIFGNDRILMGLTFMGAIPVLFYIRQVNPLFLAAVIIAQILIYFYFRNELWGRLIRK